jgi:uncharacterized protein
MKAKMSKMFYFDTYALVEIYKGNSNYEKYSKNVGMILHKFNILEYVHFLLREKRNENLVGVFRELNAFVVDSGDEILIKAAEMKLSYNKEKLSFVDCIGYFLAKKHRVKFLTGDEKFRDKENVEFVK